MAITLLATLNATVNEGFLSADPVAQKGISVDANSGQVNRINMAANPPVIDATYTIPSRQIGSINFPEIGQNIAYIGNQIYMGANPDATFLLANIVVAAGSIVGTLNGASSNLIIPGQTVYFFNMVGAAFLNGKLATITSFTSPNTFTATTTAVGTFSGAETGFFTPWHAVFAPFGDTAPTIGTPIIYDAQLFNITPNTVIPWANGGTNYFSYVDADAPNMGVANTATSKIIGKYPAALQGWRPSHGYFTGSDSIVDPNGNIQACTTSGTTGGVAPAFNGTPGGTTTDGGATWTNVNGFAGATNAPLWSNSVPNNNISGTEPLVYVNPSNGDHWIVFAYNPNQAIYGGFSAPPTQWRITRIRPLNGTATLHCNIVQTQVFTQNAHVQRLRFTYNTLTGGQMPSTGMLVTSVSGTTGSGGIYNFSSSTYLGSPALISAVSPTNDTSGAFEILTTTPVAGFFAETGTAVIQGYFNDVKYWEFPADGDGNCGVSCFIDQSSGNLVVPCNLGAIKIFNPGTGLVTLTVGSFASPTYVAGDEYPNDNNFPFGISTMGWPLAMQGLVNSGTFIQTNVADPTTGGQPAQAVIDLRSSTTLSIQQTGDMQTVLGPAATYGGLSGNGWMGVAYYAPSNSLLFTERNDSSHIYVLGLPSSGVPTIVGIASNANPVGIGQPLTFTITVTDGLATPTGTVVLSIDGIAVSGTLTLVNGVATYSSAGLLAGYHLVTAAYTPSGAFLSSTGQMYEATTQYLGAFALIATYNPTGS